MGMYDYDELVHFNIANCPKSLLLNFDKKAKQSGFGNRSSCIKAFMSKFCQNMQFEFARQASMEQMLQWGITDAVKENKGIPIDQRKQYTEYARIVQDISDLKQYVQELTKRFDVA
jgi:hypothetical protein